MWNKFLDLFAYGNDTLRAVAILIAGLAIGSGLTAIGTGIRSQHVDSVNRQYEIFKEREANSLERLLRPERD